MDPRGPCNISGGPKAKHNKLGVHNDILGVHEENKLRTLFIFKNSISTVIYIILNRFSDLLGIDIPIWVSIPFKLNVAEIQLSLQEPLIELQSDKIMRAKFKGGKYNIWKTNDVATKYPLLWDKAQLYVIAFPTPFLVEAGFSRVSQILSKARNRLDIVKRGDL